MSYPFIHCKSRNQEPPSREKSLMSVTFLWGWEILYTCDCSWRFWWKCNVRWFVPLGRKLVRALFLSSWSITYMKSLISYHIFDTRYKFTWHMVCQVWIYKERALTYNHLLIYSSLWNGIKVHLEFSDCVKKLLESTLLLTAQRAATLLCCGINWMSKWLLGGNSLSSKGSRWLPSSRFLDTDLQGEHLRAVDISQVRIINGNQS